MRVLTVVDYLGAGGTQRAAVNYAIGYQRMGYESAVLAYWDGGVRLADLEKEDVTLFVGKPDLAWKNRMVAMADAWNPDVIHVHRKNPDDCPLTGPVEKLKRKGRVVMETSVFSRFDVNRRFQLFDVSLHLSRWALWKWRRWSKRVPSRAASAVVPYSVDTTAFRPESQEGRQAFRLQRHIPPDAFVFGRVGQPIESKWSEILLTAFSAVARHRPHVWLLLVGAPDSILNRVRTLPERVAGRILSLPFGLRDEALRLCYSAMDVFLHASAIG